MPHKRLIIGSHPDSCVTLANGVQFFSGQSFNGGVIVNHQQDGVSVRRVQTDMVDLDGTVMPLLSDPSMRRIDPAFLAGMRLKQEFYPNTIIVVTGRDYPQVIEVMNGVKPFFPVITSNGADLTLPNGGVRFSYPFSKKEIEFFSMANKEVLAFAKEHPFLVVESKERSIGFHKAARHGSFDSMRGKDVLDNIIKMDAEAAGDLWDFLQEEANASGINIEKTGAEIGNVELQHALVNKADSPNWFAQHLSTLPQSNDWSSVNFFGDSLHGLGNDRKMAIRVRELGGTVIMVINGSPHRLPSEGSPAEPHFAFSTPEELGEFYFHQVSTSIARDFGCAALQSACERHNIKPRCAFTALCKPV